MEDKEVAIAEITIIEVDLVEVVVIEVDIIIGVEVEVVRTEVVGMVASHRIIGVTEIQTEIIQEVEEEVEAVVTKMEVGKNKSGKIQMEILILMM